MLPEATLAALREIVGADALLADPPALAPYAASGWDAHAPTDAGGKVHGDGGVRVDIVSDIDPIAAAVRGGRNVRTRPRRDAA